MNEVNQPLSGQQLAQIQKQMAQAFASAMEKMELRKEAVRVATEVIKAVSFPSSTIFYGNPVELAEGIYNFMVQPVAEIKITISE